MLLFIIQTVQKFRQPVGDALINAELGSLLGISRLQRFWLCYEWFNWTGVWHLIAWNALIECMYTYLIQLQKTLHVCLCFFFVFGFISWLTHALNTTCDSHPSACNCEILNTSDSVYILINQVILVSELKGWF